MYTCRYVTERAGTQEEASSCVKMIGLLVHTRNMGRLEIWYGYISFMCNNMHIHICTHVYGTHRAVTQGEVSYA